MSKLDTTFASRQAVVDTKTTRFVMGYLPVNRCFATWREDDGHQALVELHATRGVASKRLVERVDFQRAVES